MKPTVRQRNATAYRHYLYDMRFTCRINAPTHTNIDGHIHKFTNIYDTKSKGTHTRGHIRSTIMHTTLYILRRASTLWPWRLYLGIEGKAHTPTTIHALSHQTSFDEHVLVRHIHSECAQPTCGHEWETRGSCQIHFQHLTELSIECTEKMSFYIVIMPVYIAFSGIMQIVRLSRNIYKQYRSGMILQIKIKNQASIII